MAEILLLTSKQCKYCFTQKINLSRHGLKFREIDVESEEGREIAKKYDIMGVPATIVRSGSEEKVFIGLMPEHVLKTVKNLSK